MLSTLTVLFLLAWKPTEVYKYIPTESIMFIAQHFPHCLSGFLQLFAWLNYQRTQRTLSHFCCAPKLPCFMSCCSRKTPLITKLVFINTFCKVHKKHVPSGWRWLQVCICKMGWYICWMFWKCKYSIPCYINHNIQKYLKPRIFSSVFFCFSTKYLRVTLLVLFSISQFLASLDTNF